MYVAQDADASYDDEEWREFEDVFVSSRGRIKRKTVSGYRIYSIEDFGKDGRYAIATIKGRRWPVHRLMAVVFLDLGMDDNRRVAFKDGDPTNLVIDNIEIAATATPSDEREQARPVGQWTHDGSTMLNRFASVQEAARALKIDASNIYKAARGKQKHAGNFTWNYVD